MYRMKSIGPIIGPWGTPLRTAGYRIDKVRYAPFFRQKRLKFLLIL